MNAAPLRFFRSVRLSPSLFQSRIPHSTFARYSSSSSSIVTMADRIHRITMFKLPKQEDQAAMIEKYKDLKVNNQKDGKPYILSLVVGPAEGDPRSQGYTLVSKTEFASLDDMKYYDDECPSHQAVKAFIKELTVEGILTVYFKPQVVGGSNL